MNKLSKRVDDAMFDLVPLFGAGVFILVIGVFVWAAFDAIFAETFSLRKDSWACTASHLETTHIPVTVNNVTTYTPSVSEVCDQWSRRS